MGLISISDLRPGMVLAQDIKDRSSRVLLAAGQTISEKHLKIFRMWGVTDADIKGAEQEDMATQDITEVDPASYQAAEEATRERFRHANTEHPGMKELRRLAVLRQAGTKTGGNNA